MKEYLKDVAEVLKEVNSEKSGLTQEEAQSRIEKNGKNKLNEAKKESIFKKILKSIADPMIIMLLVTAAISAGVSVYQGDSFTDVFIILFVVLVNTVMGLIQECKAEKAIDSLKKMTAATTTVLRDGVENVIESEDIVVGDVIVLETGDLVPADCRITESYSMKIDESALTGESVTISKVINALELGESINDISLGDRRNMIYSGSTVTFGRGKAVVVATGMDTEIGKIAKSLNEAKDEETPLQKKMAELSKVLTKIVVLICVIVFVVGIIRHGTINGRVAIDTFLTAIALAVAAIPEGLPAVVTIVLSIGVTEMSKRNALIRKLNAVETLGCIQVICSDKTGTLTQNKMTVVEHFGDDEQLLGKAMALCSDSIIIEGEERAKGEPTENGLVEYAYRIGLNKDTLEKDEPRIGEVPFDSMRKMMSTFHKKDAIIIQYTKGAIEMLLDKCDRYLDNGKVVPITKEYKDKVLKVNKEFASKALRVLGVAYKEYNEIPDEYDEKLENDMIFIGFTGMIDPCRDEVKDSIKECKRASIRPIMITGDQKDTAVAIAKQLGIIDDADQAMTGLELNNVSDEEINDVVKKYSVFARVQPEHKTRIVNALQDMNYIVAMTGDGVNDAPSIKAADVGVSMGITGTDVTKGTSDVVLADDNFATIVNAVEEGRKIFDNVRKVIQFQLSTNMAEVLAVFTSSLCGITMLTPAHLLWINMITDSAPGLALGMEKAEGDVMNRKPRPTNDSVFSQGAGKDMIWQGVVMACLVVLSYFIGTFIDSGKIQLIESVKGMSMCFITMNFIEMFHCICMRSQRNSIFKLKTFNWWLLGAAVLTTIITLGVLYIPFFVNLFGFVHISFSELLVAMALAFAIIPIIEIEKMISKKSNKKIKE